MLSQRKSADTNYPKYLEPTFLFFKNYAKSLTMASKEDTSSYLLNFGRASQKKLRTYFSQIDDEKFNAFRDIQTSFQNLYYIIDSRELFIVFYNHHNLNEKKRNGARYNFILKDNNDSFKIINFLIEDSLDQLLKWPKFYNKMIK